MTCGPWAQRQDAFVGAARWFVQTVPAGRGRWDEPALGEWTVRDLVGHTSRALLTVETYLDRPAETADVTSPVGYFDQVLAATGDPAAVAQRGRDAGQALGPDPEEAVAVIAERVLPRVRAAAAEELLTTPAGGMRLGDYLPTRTFELVVHTCDLATALGREGEVPGPAARQALTVLGGLTERSGQAAPLLLAATGRGALPAGFTVL